MTLANPTTGERMDYPNYSYIAGFFDADGCVSIIKQKRKRMINMSYDLQCHIVNTKLNILLEIQKVIGGTISTVKPKTENWSICYKLYFGCNKAYDFLKKIYPYSILKKDRIYLAIKFQELKQNNKYQKLTEEGITKREAFWLELKQLNQKGGHYGD